MALLVLLSVEIWVLCATLFALHYQNRRFGLTPILFYIAGAVSIMQFASPLQHNVEPFDGLTLATISDVMVPFILVGILTLYIVNGTEPARSAILGIVLITSFILIFLLVSRSQLDILFTENTEVNPIFDPDIRLAFASILTFMADFVVIIVFFQGAKNHLTAMPDWLTPLFALMAGVWCDSIVFYLLGTLGTSNFGQVLPGDVVGKTFIVVVSSPLVVYYLRYLAPQLPEYVGTESRPTFDLLFGDYRQLKAQLLQSQEQLRENRAYYQQLTDNINEVFWLVSPDLKTLFYVSPAYERITGFPPDNLYKNLERFYDIVHPEDRPWVRERRLNLAETGEIEYRIVRNDETVRWIRYRSFPVKDQHGTVYRVAGIAEDITLRKQNEAHHMVLAVEQERVKVLRDFISDASHDLRSPLSAMNLKIDLLEVTRDDNLQQHHLNDLREQIQRFTQLIDNLFTLSRLEGDADDVYAMIDPGTLLNDIHRQLLPIAEAKKQQLLLIIESSSLPRIMAHAEDLSRAITNLVDNAIKYTPEAGVIMLQVTAENTAIVIQISDSGIGIDENELPQVFGRFFRATTARDARITGTGLGLAIAKAAIDRHHGEISVESKGGQGTTFTIRLPVV
jgi:PAS domain S-box-containing protein